MLPFRALDLRKSGKARTCRGVVRGAVKRAIPGDGFGHHCLHVRFVGNVGLNEKRLPASLFHQGDGFSPGFGSIVDDDHPGPIGCEGETRGPTDAGASARHETDLSFE